MTYTKFFSKLSCSILVVALASTALAPTQVEAKMGGGAKMAFKPAAGGAKIARPGSVVKPVKPTTVRPAPSRKPGIQMPNRTPKVTRPGGKPGMNPGLPKNRPMPAKAGLAGNKGKAKTDFNKAAGVPKKAAPPPKRGLAGNKGRAKTDFNKAAGVPKKVTPPAKRGLAGNKGLAKRDFNNAAKPPTRAARTNQLNHNPPTPRL